MAPRFPVRRAKISKDPPGEKEERRARGGKTEHFLARSPVDDVDEDDSGEERAVVEAPREPIGSQLDCTYLLFIASIQLFFSIPLACRTR